jgi:hypothetical protein
MENRVLCSSSSIRLTCNSTQTTSPVSLEFGTQTHSIFCQVMFYIPHVVPVHTGLIYVRSELLTAVVTESSVVWDITPCSSLKVNQRFEGTCLLRLQGRIISLEGSKQNKINCKTGQQGQQTYILVYSSISENLWLMNRKLCAACVAYRLYISYSKVQTPGT